MKKIIPLFIVLLTVSWFWSSEKKENNEMVEKKWFKSDNVFLIICKGWPKESLTGKARLDSAKEAALINAQFTARDLFDKSVDVVRNGNIEEYKVFDDYVTIKYSIKYPGLRKFYKDK